MFQPQSQKWTPRIELPIPKPVVTNQLLSIEIIFKGFWIMSPELDAGWFTNFRHPCDGFSKIWLGFCILRWIGELTHCRVSPLFQHDQNPSSLSKLHRSKQLWVSTVILGGVFVQFDAKCATPYLWWLRGLKSMKPRQSTFCEITDLKSVIKSRKLFHKTFSWIHIT